MRCKASIQKQHDPSHSGSWHLIKIDPEISSRYSLDTGFVYPKDHGRSSTLSANPIVRDLRTRMCDVYLYSVSFRVASANFCICWIIQHESSAVRINDSPKIANSFELPKTSQMSRRVNSRERISLLSPFSLKRSGRDRLDLHVSRDLVTRSRYKSTMILRRLRSRLLIPLSLQHVTILVNSDLKIIC